MNMQQNGLTLERDFSLSIKQIADFPSQDKLLLADTENEKFLKTSTIWHDPIDVEDLDGIGLELRRQDLKITLLMEMVSELLIKQSHLPPLVTSRLTANGLQCHGDVTQYPAETKVEILLYIVTAFPKPLKLYGEVIQGDDNDSAEQNLSIQFVGMSPNVKDRIEKLIFTEHRRSIAQNLSQ